MKMNANVKVLGRLTPHKFPWQENVIDIQEDGTLDPGASPAEGARYLVTDFSTLHANFLPITGVADGDIIEYVNGAFEVVWDASVNGEGAKVYDKDSNGWYEFDGTNWNAEAASSVSALNDLSDVVISAPAGGHILVYDGTDSFDNVPVSGDISISSTGVAAISAGVITNADVNVSAGIAESKLALDFSTSSLNSSIGANTSDIADLRTTQGTSDGDTNLGTFTGTTIPDSSSVKSALQSLETAVETKADSSVVTEIDGNVDDLITLSGVAENATDLGTFTGSTIPDSQTIKQALQSLETKAEANEALINGLEWQDSALDYVVDNTAAPATEVSGDRYVLSHDGGAPNAAYDGASAGDIVEFDGSVWVATTPTTGMFISVDDEADVLYYWGGAAWATKSFEATTASTGLTKVGLDIQLADAAANNGVSVSSGAISLAHDGEGLDIVSNQLALELDGSTLSKSATGVKVADGGIGATQLAAGVLDRYNAVIGGSTAIAVNHALGLTNGNACHITMHDVNTGEQVIADSYTFTDGNNLTVNFASAPAASSIRINITSAEDIA